MMLYPPMSELAAKAGSRYLLVNLVARRARNIAAAAQSRWIPNRFPWRSTRCMTAAFRSCTRNKRFQAGSTRLIFSERGCADAADTDPGRKSRRSGCNICV